LGGYYSDNTSYPWKHWTGKQIFGGFMLGPAGGFFLASINMFSSLWNQRFIFERCWTATSFFLLSVLFFACFGKYFLSGDELANKREEWEKVHGKWVD
jgi:hypothetical protein